MPRRATSATALIVNFFITASLDAAKQALDTAKAIITAREGVAGTLPLSGDSTKMPRRRRERRALQGGLPGVTAAPATTGAATVAGVGPTAMTPAAPRRRRGRAANAVRTGEAPGVTELPPQVPAEE